MKIFKSQKKIQHLNDNGVAWNMLSWQSICFNFFLIGSGSWQQNTKQKDENTKIKEKLDILISFYKMLQLNNF